MGMHRRNAAVSRRWKLLDRRLLSLLVAALFAATFVVSVEAASAAERRWVESAKLTASDGDYLDRLGSAVAIGNDVVAAATTGWEWYTSDPGSVYVFERASTGWVESAELVPSDGGIADWFGRSIAIGRDTIVVGAPAHSPAQDVAGRYTGSVYVFTRTANGWIESAKLNASEPEVGDAFGWSVAMDGDTIVVGAQGDDAQGAVYVFRRTPRGWAESAKLTASEAVAGDAFGYSVAIDGSTIVASTPLDDVAGGSLSDNSGSAYVFERTKTGWVESAKLVASDLAASDWFGVSSAVDGNTILIGAYRSDGVDADTGAAYVFERTASGWVESAKLSASDGSPGDLFGRSVAIDGDAIAVGAPQRDDSGFASGAVYMFGRAPSGWVEAAKLTADVANEHDEFGAAVALDRTTMVVAQPGADDGGSAFWDSGAVYLFTTPWR